QFDGSTSVPASCHATSGAGLGRRLRLAIIAAGSSRRTFLTSGLQWRGLSPMNTSSPMRRIVGALLVLACLVPSLTASSAHAERAHASVTLTFWTSLSGPLERSLLVPYFHQFEKSHPDITVKFVVVPGSNNFIKYTTAMAAGRGPDVVLTYSYNPPTPEWAADGFIQPLDPWFTQLHISQ